MGEAAVAGEGMHAARETFGRTLEVIVDIFVPVGAILAGVFMPTALGGGLSIANAIYNNFPASGSGTLPNRAAWGLQALINGAVGGAFWGMRHRGGLILKAIGGAVGGFFLGSALGCIPGVVTGSQISGGLIDSLATGIQKVAKEA